ncbi:Mu transposase domain-containing protein [Raoultella terrigena]|uniref:Mu transposase domain-containing protein n=1 Tax=Raoultella terrigena TaxID=577 RepID=UPI0035D029CA
MKVAPTCHVQYARHRYSVAHKLVGPCLLLKAGQMTIARGHQGQRVTRKPSVRFKWRRSFLMKSGWLDRF